MARARLSLLLCDEAFNGDGFWAPEDALTLSVRPMVARMIRRLR